MSENSYPGELAMQSQRLLKCATLAACVLVGNLSSAADQYGLSQGTPELKSAGPMAFGPDDILFVADTKAAAVFAIRTGEVKGDPQAAVNVDGLNVKLAELLNAQSGSIEVTDLAVSPASGRVYLAVAGGKSGPAIVRVGSRGKLEQFSLENVAFSKADLPNPPEDAVTGEGRRRRNSRGDAVTDLTFFEGRLIVSGLSSQGPGSAVMSINFPFSEFSPPAALEIYHGAHGRVEDAAAPRTFVPFMIDGEPHLLAGYVCTPLVKFPLSDLQGGKKTRGTTVAELGNHNQPLDMISYTKDGQSYLLLANSARGVMKISTEDIAREEGITQPVGDGGTAGQKYETIKSLEGTTQLDQLNDTQAVALIKSDGGSLDLKTVELP